MNLSRQPSVGGAGLVLLGHALLAWGLWQTGLNLQTPAADVAGSWRPVQATLLPAQRAALPAQTRQPSAQTRQATPPAQASDAAAAQALQTMVPARSSISPAAALESATAAAPDVSRLAAPSSPIATAQTQPPPPNPAPPAARRVAADHLACAKVPYPAVMQERGVEGVLRLRVHVNAAGQASEVQLLASSGWRLFDEAALAQVRACRFRPARQGDEAVADWVEFPVRFAIDG